MKYHLIILLTLAVAASYQQNHGCKVGCECPDFPSLFDPKENQTFFYEKYDSCSFNLTCPERENGALWCKFNESEIPTPSDSYDGVLDIIARPYAGPGIPTYDIFSTFGLICENGSWYATKYPIGIQYYITRDDNTQVGSAKDYEGMKSRVTQALCWYFGG